MAELRRMLRGTKPRLKAQGPVGSPVAPDNSMMLIGRGQIATIYDVLDAEGNEIFILGASSLEDPAVVE